MRKKNLHFINLSKHLKNKIFFKFLYTIIKKRLRINLINDHKTTNLRLLDFQQNYVTLHIKKLNILICW